MKTPEEQAGEITAKFYIDQKLPLSAGTYSLDAMIAQAIREAVEAAAPRWIPVGERLPAYNPDGKNAYWVIWYPMLGGPAHRDEALWSDIDCWLDPDTRGLEDWLERITHWISIPPDPVS